MESPKYNRTLHMPWSKGATNDDKIALSVNGLIGKSIIITEKMDGSNASLEFEGCFARTHSGPPNHPSFDAFKALHASVKWQILDNIQLFGEYCFAKHSIEYNELPGYFMLFGVAELMEHPFSDSGRIWHSWRSVEEWAEKIGVPTVPVLFSGVLSTEKELKELTESFMIQPSACGGVREGVVVRCAESFYDAEFSNSILKNVRANHVQTSEHWKDQEIIRNKLK